MSKVVDNLIAARIIYLLVLPFPKWEAYKEGIITETGERTEQEADSDNWSMLHRLVWRLKKLLGKVPGGKSMIASIAAAYLLVRENLDQENVDVEHKFLNETTDISFKDYTFVVNELSKLVEEGEAPTNVVGGVAGIRPEDEPPVRVKKKKVKKQNGSIIIP